MKSIVITKSGGTEVLQIQKKEDPIPTTNEMLIQVKAAGINFADILARKGIYPDAPPIPCVVGYEVSGIVKQIGTDVNESWLGKSVMALTRFGGYSDLVVAPEIQVFEKPEDLTFEQAAAIPVNYLTAYQLLVVMGGLKSNETVLIHNVGGGVGLAALDIAKKIGAVVYGTASAHKHQYLEKRWIDHTIDYRKEDWLKEIGRLTNGRGVELIIDPLGGQHWKKSYQALRGTGRLGMFGLSNASTGLKMPSRLKLFKTVLQIPWFHPIGMMNANKGVFGVNLGHLWHEPEKVRDWMNEILNGVHERWVHPHVDKIFPFEKVGAAQGYIEARKNIGKVILVPEA